MRFLVLLWGLVAYVAFWAAFIWTIIFLGYDIVPKKYQERLYAAMPWAADSESGGSATSALALNIGLLAAFMLPNWFLNCGGCQRICVGMFGKGAARSTQVLVSSLLLGLVYWKWAPIPEEVRNLAQYKTALQYAFWIGWSLVLLGTFMVGHFRLTGLRQAFLYFRGREDTAVTGGTLFNIGRHVLLVGLLLGLLSTPRMTLGHLLFGVPMALYVVLCWATAGRKALSTVPVTAPVTT